MNLLKKVGDGRKHPINLESDFTPIYKIFPIAMNYTIHYISELEVCWAPGRVNLIGEHTDYNVGFVMPIAVYRVVAFASRVRRDRIVRIWTNYFHE